MVAFIFYIATGTAIFTAAAAVADILEMFLW
jgi:hypothetical protein